MGGEWKEQEKKWILETRKSCLNKNLKICGKANRTKNIKFVFDLQYIWICFTFSFFYIFIYFSYFHNTLLFSCFAGSFVKLGGGRREGKRRWEERRGGKRRREEKRRSGASNETRSWTQENKCSGIFLLFLHSFWYKHGICREN